MPIKKTLEMAILGGSALALSALALSACTRDSLSALRGHPDAVSYDGGSDRKDTNDGVSEGNDGGTDASDGNFDLFDAGRDVPPKCPEPWLDCPEDGGFGDGGDAGPSGDGGLADGSTDAGSADASDGEVPTDAGSDADGGIETDGGSGDAGPGGDGGAGDAGDAGPIIPADWLDTEWTYRMPFIAWQTGDSPLSNIPFLANRLEGTFYIDTAALIADGKLQLDCDDLRFAYPGGPLVPFEFENRSDLLYGCDTPNTTIWTRADLPASPLERTLHMYYGNPAAPDGEDTTAVWDTNYVAVWHFGEGSGSAVNDPTSFSNNGFLEGPANWEESNIGRGFNFNGTTNRVIIPSSPTLNFNETDSFTVEVWVSYLVNGSSFVYKMGGSAPTGDPIGYEVLANSEGNARFIIRDTDGVVASADSSFIADGNWHYLVVVRDASAGNVLMYTDGLLTNTNPDPTTATLSNSGPLYLGHRTIGNSYFSGRIDEARISNTARSADFIKRSYEQELSRLETEENL